MLEDIDEGDDALLCLTNYTDCCQGYDTGEMLSALGNWYFPNGTKVPYEAVNRISGEKWDFYRDEGIGWWYVCTAEKVEWKGSTTV